LTVRPSFEVDIQIYQAERGCFPEGLLQRSAIIVLLFFSTVVTHII
jgi:hypothetical protein